MIDYERNPEAQAALLIGVLLGMRLALLLQGKPPRLPYA